MFKDKLKKLRQDNKLTQEELGEKLHVSRSAIAKWEQGRGLPREDMLDEIAIFFNVSKDYLYNEDEPNLVIQVLTRKTQRSVIVLSSIILLLLITIVMVLVIKREKSKDDYSLYDSFFPTKRLDSFYLKEFKNITEDSDGSILFNDNYFQIIDSQETFESYAEYILNYLINSPYIAYVGFGIDEPLNRRNYDNLETYILASSNLSDYSGFRGNELKYHNYIFYFIPKLDYNHQKKDKIYPNFISISYYPDYNKGVKLTPNDEMSWVNFTMSIHSTKKYGFGDYYLFDDYFDFDKIEVTSDNYEDYIFFDVIRISDGRYWYRVWFKEHFFKTYLAITIRVENKDVIETNSTIVYSREDGKTIPMGIVNSHLSEDLNSIIYLFDIEIEGYVYWASNK